MILKYMLLKIKKDVYHHSGIKISQVYIDKSYRDPHINDIDISRDIDSMIIDAKHIKSYYIDTDTNTWHSKSNIVILYDDKNIDNIKISFNNDEYMKILCSDIEECMSSVDENNKIYQRLDELENMIKYLPMVSQQFMDAKTDFTIQTKKQ